MTLAQQSIPHILVAIPTCQRPKFLQRAMSALISMQPVENARITFAVVDNDAQCSARSVVADFNKQHETSIQYTNEPRRGLSNVRNRIIDYGLEQSADYIASIDDDNVASSEWLRQIYHHLITYPADLCFGLEINVVAGRSRFSTRTLRGKLNWRAVRPVSGASSSNYIMRRRVYDEKKMRFDTQYNFSGSEDADFFKRAALMHMKMIRVETAQVFHTYPAERYSFKQYTRRKYIHNVCNAYIDLQLKILTPLSLYLKVFKMLLTLPFIIIFLPLTIFHRRLRWKSASSFLKPIAYIHALFGLPSSIQPYVDPQDMVPEAIGITDRPTKR